VVFPADSAAGQSVTRGVTDQPHSLCRAENRCVRSMRPVRGMSNRAPLKPQSKDRSLCVRRRVVSRAGVFTQAYLRNAWNPSELRESPFTPRFVGVPHVIAATQHASLNQSKSDGKIGIVKSNLRVYAIRMVFITKCIQILFVYCTQSAARNRTTQTIIFQSAEVLNRRRKPHNTIVIPN